MTENLELSTNMLQKELNGSKPLSREWLIAICAAFGLDFIRINNEKNNINRPHMLKEINDYLVENVCDEICSKFKRNKDV